MSEKKPLSLIGKIFIGLFVSYGIIFLTVLWGGTMDAFWFIKISITYAVVIVVLAIVYLVKREFVAESEMQDKKYMD